MINVGFKLDVNIGKITMHQISEYPLNQTKLSIYWGLSKYGQTHCDSAGRADLSRIYD